MYNLTMLFVTRVPIILIVCTNCNLLVSDCMLQNVLKSIPNFYSCRVQWCFGIYDLGWTVNQNTARYHAIVVIGFSIKGMTDHYNLITQSCYHQLVWYPIVNLITICNSIEEAWQKAISFNHKVTVKALTSIIGINSIIVNPINNLKTLISVNTNIHIARNYHV